MKSIALAHSLAIATAVLYILCVILLAVSPDLYFAILTPWFHGVDVRQFAATALPGFDQVLFGLISMTAMVWVFTYVTAELYKRLAKTV